MRLSLFLTTLQPEVGLLFFLFYFTNFDFFCPQVCACMFHLANGHQSRAVFVHETFFLPVPSIHFCTAFR